MNNPNINKLKIVKKFIFPILILLLSSCSDNIDPNRKIIAEEMHGALTENLLDVWYPAVIDSVYGGFLSDFTYDWKADGPQDKMLVTQTRHVWTASVASMFLEDDYLAEIADHGFSFLKDKMLDKEHGGFYMQCNRQGEPSATGAGQGMVPYGNAFAIYALSSYYRLSGNEKALDLAKKTFLWLDSTCYDPVHKGYFNNMMWREGTMTMEGRGAMPSRVVRTDRKGQNTSLHIMEAFAELYTVWPDSLLRERLTEMLHLMRDKFTTEKGYLVLYMERDWTPVSYKDSSEAVQKNNHFQDHVSFGHDIEAGYLMLEASHVLGIEHDEKTLEIAKKMVDHTLDKGWDHENGGVYYEGYYYDESDSITIINNIKEWWVQAEAMNSLLLMSDLFPEEVKYKQAFEKQWEYIKTYMIDHEHGGWYTRGLDISPRAEQAPKASPWKGNYHNARTLMNCISMLNYDFALQNE